MYAAGLGVFDAQDEHAGAAQNEAVTVRVNGRKPWQVRRCAC
jgi:hypothetical protein